MSRSAAAVAAGLVLATASLALPSVRRYAGFPPDGPDPRYDVPLPAKQIRITGERVQRYDMYLLTAPGADPLTQGNLKAAGQLFFSPSLPVQGGDFDVSVVYRAAQRRFVLRPWDSSPASSG
jgi:hypothetical protein